MMFEDAWEEMRQKVLDGSGIDMGGPEDDAPMPGGFLERDVFRSALGAMYYSGKADEARFRENLMKVHGVMSRLRKALENLNYGQWSCSVRDELVELSGQFHDEYKVWAALAWDLYTNGSPEGVAVGERLATYAREVEKQLDEIVERAKE